jgi:hypothetical protein
MRVRRSIGEFMISLLISMTVCSFAVGCQSATPAATAPATSSAEPPILAPDDEPLPPGVEVNRDDPDKAIAPLDPGVGDMLDRIEAASKDLKSFTAAIVYEKQDEILGRREMRTGEIIYRVDPQTKEKAFAVIFDAVIVNKVKRPSDRHYIFNGRWLVEIDHENKQFIKREIVPPGKTLDPLKLGEGPFPLPIGQSKEEVLERFDVTMMQGLPEENLLKDLANVDGLLLVPKPGMPEFDEFARVALFYDRETSLPVGIFAVEANADRKIVRLRDLKRNPQLDDATLRKLDIAEPDPKEWRIDIQPWREEKKPAKPDPIP